MIVIVFLYFLATSNNLSPEGLYHVVLQPVIGTIIADLHVRTRQKKLSRYSYDT